MIIMLAKSAFVEKELMIKVALSFQIN